MDCFVEPVIGAHSRPVGSQWQRTGAILPLGI